MGCWFLITVLESPSRHDAESARENLEAAVAAIIGQESALAREIKVLYPEPEPAVINPGSGTEILVYRPSTPVEGASIACNLDDSNDSDSETGPLTPSSSEFPFPDTYFDGRLATLADFSKLNAIIIPLAQPGYYGQFDDPEPSIKTSSKNTSIPITPQHPSLSRQLSPAPLEVITISTSGVDIAPLPQGIERLSLTQPPFDTTQAVSAESIFHLPEVTNKAVLDFFRRAVKVSRLSAQFAREDHSRYDKHGPSQREKIKTLGGKKFRELCTDLYDELVRRNVEDQSRNDDNLKRNGSVDKRVRFAVADGFDTPRVQARRRLQTLSDRQMVSFITVVMAELERRSPGPEWTEIVEQLKDGACMVSTAGTLVPMRKSAIDGVRQPANVAWESLYGEQTWKRMASYTVTS
ncbi:component of the polarisome [Collariella sp. IMI 366227]|nr:component of the polarisome [Collariella sp. IMI 366227]